MMSRKKIPAIIVMVAAGIIFVSVLVRSLFYAPAPDSFDTSVISTADNVEQTQPDLAFASSSIPVRLSIPSLKVDAKVQTVGRTAQNKMGVPTNFTDVGWYRYGAMPGELGSAVIAGHVDNGLALAGVFKRLNEMKIGDEVFITDNDENRRRFVVEQISVYPLDAAPADLVFNRSDKRRLNLVTCDGVWIPSLKTYDRRIVVYTTLQ